MTLRNKLLSAALIVAGLTIQGCSATCEDACEQLLDCAGELGLETNTTQSECVTNCEASNGCPEDKKQEMIDCIMDAECESKDAFAFELMSCSLKCE